MQEEPVSFPCEGEQLVGVLACPARPADTGVVIVVGGPQYRIGSHRQFVHLARSLARSGFAVLRFDYRGMGDSDGATRTFEEVNTDIAAAVDCLTTQLPTVRQIVLWGLCDGASAAMMYAPSDPRITGIVAANPWARSSETEARTMLNHYYLRRLLSVSFWRKLAGNKVDLRRSAGEFAGRLSGARRSVKQRGHFRDRMAEAMTQYQGKVLFMTCDRDLTAQEFESFARPGLSEIRTAAGHARTWVRFAVADHTFSGAEPARNVAEKTAEWLRTSFPIANTK